MESSVMYWYSDRLSCLSYLYAIMLIVGINGIHVLQYVYSVQWLNLPLYIPYPHFLNI